MTEPADEGGAGSDPSMMQTDGACGRQPLGDQRPQGLHHRRRRRRGRHRHGASRTRAPACSWSTCPIPAIRIERVLDTIDSSMPGGHAVVTIDNLRVPRRPDARRERRGLQICAGAPAARRGCRTACAGWAPRTRAQEIATDYACTRAGVRQAADRPRRRRLHARRQPDRPEAGRADDRLVRRRARHRLARHGRKLDGQGRGVRGAVPRRRPLRPGDGRHRRHAATPSSSRCSARSAPSASTTARPRCTNGRWPRRSSATGRLGSASRRISPANDRSPPRRSRQGGSSNPPQPFGRSFAAGGGFQDLRRDMRSHTCFLK